MRGSKGTVYQGGTRAPCFFRWPAGGIQGDAECDALSAHLDLFPTLAEITGAKLSDDVKKQVEGRSLLCLLKNPKAEWAERTLVHHVGRWAKGKSEEAKFKKAAIQNLRFTLVNNEELYDLKAVYVNERGALAPFGFCDERLASFTGNSIRFFRLGVRAERGHRLLIRAPRCQKKTGNEEISRHAFGHRQLLIYGRHP